MDSPLIKYESPPIASLTLDAPDDDSDPVDADSEDDWGGLDDDDDDGDDSAVAPEKSAPKQP